MGKNVFAVKLDKDVLEEVREFCEEMGYKQNAFVEKALKAQMAREELKEDIFDLVSLRSQEKMARPFDEYHKSRR